MAKSPNFNCFFFAEEVVTNSGVIRRFFYQEVCDKNEKSFPRAITYDEPMDVDTSTETTLKDSSPNLRLHPHDLTDTYTDSELKPIRKPHLSTFGKFLIILTLTILTTHLIFFQNGDYYLHLNPEIQFRYIKHTLKENLLNQDEAVITIGHNLDDIIHTQTFKLLVFIGTTGVGKTFAANLMKKFYLPKHIHEVSVEDLSDDTIINKLDSCCYNLILVDNLRATHLHALKEFVLKLPLDYKLLVIPIFNVHDTINGIEYTINTNDFNLIRKKIDELNVDFELVVFRQLDHNVVEGWLKEKLNEKGVHSSRHDKLIESMLSEDHVKKKGFKELDAKMTLVV